MLYTTGSGQDDVLDLSTEEREEQFRRCSRRWWSAGKWYQYRLSTLLFITALLATIMGGVIAKARAKCPRLTIGLIRCSVFSW
jgi:hypothetical protein